MAILKKKVLFLLFCTVSLCSSYAQNSLGENYTNRVGLSYATDPTSFVGISSFEVLWGINMGSFWIDAFYGSSFGHFNSIASNSDRMATSFSEGHFLRKDDQSFNLMQTGLGLSLDSAFFNKVFNTSQFFEYSTAIITYSIYQDELRNDISYSGAGLRTDYAVNYRLHDHVQAALRFSYRLSPVTRASVNDFPEARRERSLFLSWLTVGGEIAVLF